MYDCTKIYMSFHSYFTKAGCFRQDNVPLVHAVSITVITIYILQADEHFNKFNGSFSYHFRPIYASRLLLSGVLEREINSYKMSFGGLEISMMLAVAVIARRVLPVAGIPSIRLSKN